MIKIIESVPRKLSGLTSFFVSFDYRPEIVNIIKNLSPAVYNKSDHT